MRIETITFEYDHCGECSNAACTIGGRESIHRCLKAETIILDLWGDIPQWCPLEDKE